MKHDMPMLTEKERNAILRRCDEMVSSWENDDTDELIAKIALASLTAEPRGRLIQSVNPQSGNVAIFYRERGINSISPEEIEEWEMSELDSLYGAPPVPALKQHKAVADALEGLLWPNMSIGNKAVIRAAIDALNGVSDA